MCERFSFYFIWATATFTTGCISSGSGTDGPDRQPLARDHGMSPPPAVDEGVSPVDAGCVRAGEEICNGADDDCDGIVDEGFDLGQCSVGVGACEATGTRVCDGEGATRCSAAAGEPSDERCNGVDDDCDGTVDEGYDLGAPCGISVAECTRRGVMVCRADGAGAVCGAEPIVVEDERCNQRDDDCDGSVDEGIVVGESCEVGVGLCRRGGFTGCGDDGAVVCQARAGQPGAEACNGFDDDCDGIPDEDFGGGRCEAGVGACLRRGFRVCGADGSLACDVEAGRPSRELCNAVDDDCDGTVDEGYVEQLGQPCSAGVGACARESVWACEPTEAIELVEGIQNDVSLEAIEQMGFRECFRSNYAGRESVRDILEGCPGEVMMIGCRDRGRANLRVAAMGLREDVLFDTGAQAAGTHEANGVAWYFSDAYSWGFAPPGEPVFRNTCDIENLDRDDRMCWHTEGGTFNDGWRCGASEWLSDGAERFVFVADVLGGGLACVGEPGAPAAVDACNGADDDCDGVIDEGNPGVGERCFDGIGGCQRGVRACAPDVGLMCMPVPIEVPSREICNGIDDDCNGAIDDLPGHGAACQVGVGACARAGVLACPEQRVELIEGIQNDVSPAALEEMGFRQCFRSTYAGREPIRGVLDACPGEVMMIGCREVGRVNLRVAAMGLREDVTFDTGRAPAGTHEANGVAWYFSDTYSWGFAPPGQPVFRNTCDIEGLDQDDRMCWHTEGGSFNGGWRCGANAWLGGATERLVFVASGGLECTAEAGAPAVEVCNGLDDDCDGRPDEGLVCPGR